MLNLDDSALQRLINTQNVFNPVMDTTMRQKPGTIIRYEDVVNHIKRHKYKTLKEIKDLLRLYDAFDAYHTNGGELYVLLKAQKQSTGGAENSTLMWSWRDALLIYSKVVRAKQLFATYNAQHPYQKVPRVYTLSNKEIKTIIAFNRDSFNNTGNLLHDNYLYVDTPEGWLAPLAEPISNCATCNTRYTGFFGQTLNGMRRGYREAAVRKTAPKAITRRSRFDYGISLLTYVQEDLKLVCTKCSPISKLKIANLATLDTALMIRRLLEPSIKETADGNSRD